MSKEIIIPPEKNPLTDNNQNKQIIDTKILRQNDWAFENFLIAPEEIERLRNISVPKLPIMKMLQTITLKYKEL